MLTGFVLDAAAKDKPNPLPDLDGNRSLGWDLLPPGSERYEFEGRTYAGYKDNPGSWVEGESGKILPGREGLRGGRLCLLANEDNKQQKGKT